MVASELLGDQLKEPIPRLFHSLGYTSLSCCQAQAKTVHFPYLAF